MLRALFPSPLFAGLFLSHGPGFQSILELIAQRAADWPFLFFVPWLILLIVADKTSTGDRLKIYAPGLAIGVSCLVLFALLAVAFTYMRANYIYNSYATLYAETSWMFSTGRPVYSALHADEHYSLPYGPAGFMIVGTFQSLLGPSFFSSKLASFLAITGGLLLVYLTVRKKTAWQPSLVLTALAAGLLFFFNPVEFWPRSDLFIFFCVALGLWASLRNGLFSALVLAAFLGVAINLKIYTFIFFLPALALLIGQRKPPWIIATIGVIAGAVALAPFVCFSNISLTNYLLVLKMDGAHRFSSSLALENIEWFVAFAILGFAPVIVSKGQTEAQVSGLLKGHSLFIAAIVVGQIVVFYPASLEGGGPHHLMAFIPIITLLAAELFSDFQSIRSSDQQYSYVGAALVLSECTFIAIYALSSGLTEPYRFHREDIVNKQTIADLQSIYQNENGTVILNAPGSDNNKTEDSYRCLLVFNGMPIGIDPVVWMDYDAGHFPEPDLTKFINAIKTRYRTPVIWVCPRGVKPFSLRSYYGAMEPVFSDRFVADFQTNFQLSRQTPCFDIYTER